MLRAIEHTFTGNTSLYNSESYDSANTMLGDLIVQSSGESLSSKWAGPLPIGIGRPMEASTAIPGIYPFAYQWTSTIDHVYLADGATAAATRRIVMYIYNRANQTFTWNGFITLTFPTATTHTIRGFRVVREPYSTGTVAVSTTSVTGSGSSWSASRLCAGSRIGFGSTDPKQISTWYEIESIASDTSITLTTSAGTISSGTSYVIEDLRIVVATTNATTTNGGLFLAKGLRTELFTPSGTTISAASTADHARAVYWLADANTVANTVACGCAIEDKADWQTHYVYVVNATSNPRVYKYNIRASLTSLSSGKTTSAFTLATQTQAVTGTVSQANNGRIANLSHGPGMSVNSLYYATTTRVYRAALNNITQDNASWNSDSMVEVPPGGTSTYSITNALNSVEASSQMDRLFVFTSGAAGIRSYVTQYNTNSTPFDHIFLVDTKQLDQSSADTGGVVHPSVQASAMSCWVEGGLAYLARIGTTALINILYAVPVGAHWTYAGGSVNQRLITPALSTANASRLLRIYVTSAEHLGTGTMGLSPEAHRMYYRTAGISDNSGEWTAIDPPYDLSGASPGNSIQIMIEFKILGLTCVPGRIFSVAVTYEDDSTDSHYEPSLTKSNLTNRIFAWRQRTAWSSDIPDMQIRLYNASTGVLVLSDTTDDEASGTWEYSTDGSSWSAWSAAADSIGNYIRYTADSLPSSVTLRALLTRSS